MLLSVPMSLVFIVPGMKCGVDVAVDGVAAPVSSVWPSAAASPGAAAARRCSSASNCVVGAPCVLIVSWRKVPPFARRFSTCSRQYSIALWGSPFLW